MMVATSSGFGILYACGCAVGPFAQQITVKHVTVNADQSRGHDQIISSRDKEDSTAALLTSGTEKPLGVLEPTLVTARTKPHG